MFGAPTIYIYKNKRNIRKRTVLRHKKSTTNNVTHVLSLTQLICFIQPYFYETPNMSVGGVAVRCCINV